MNEFERVVREYMSQRGVRTYRELHARVLATGGFADVGRDELERTIVGSGAGAQRPRAPRINKAIAESLNLSEAERMRMAQANVPRLFTE